jgi:hypothetical protein
MSELWAGFAACGPAFSGSSRPGDRLAGRDARPTTPVGFSLVGALARIAAGTLIALDVA